MAVQSEGESWIGIQGKDAPSIPALSGPCWKAEPEHVAILACSTSCRHFLWENALTQCSLLTCCSDTGEHGGFQNSLKSGRQQGHIEPPLLIFPLKLLQATHTPWLTSLSLWASGMDLRSLCRTSKKKGGTLILSHPLLLSLCSLSSLFEEGCLPKCWNKLAFFQHLVRSIF